MSEDDTGQLLDTIEAIVPPILAVTDIAIAQEPIIPRCRCGSPLVMRSGDDLERCERCGEWMFNCWCHSERMSG